MRRTIHNAADMGVAPPAGKCETDVSICHMFCNGENLFAQPFDLEGNAAEGIFDAGWIPAEFSGQDRPADIIRQSYADLCFDFDHFFGRPGVAVLDDEIASVGLDQALTDLGEPGESIQQGLLSTEIVEYLSAI